MKNLKLITVITITLFIGNVNASEFYSTPSETAITSTDEVKKKMAEIRVELQNAGYSQFMMDELFGDENFYFPKSQEDLETVLHIVNLLIENEQFEESDRPALISLAKSAYTQYSNVSLSISRRSNIEE